MAKELAKLFVALGLDDKEFGKSLDRVQKSLTQAGKLMTGIGAGITASLGLATKSALEEQVGINRLSTQLQAAGADYAALSEEIEKSIAATQRKTSFGDEEQRDALTELVGVTGTYEGALEQLQIAIDLAAAKQMDLSSAATLVGRAALGDTELLSRYGIKVKEGATATEVLAQMQERFAGAAEGAADPLKQLQNSFGDMVQDIGAQLLPVLKQLVDAIMPVIDSIRNWMAENPGLTKTFVLVAAAIGGVFVVLGPLLMMLPAIAAGFTIMLGPVGLAVAALAGLIAIGTLVWMNWDKIVDFFRGIPEKIGAAFSTLKDIILAPFRAAWEGIGAGLNWLIDQLNKIKISIPPFLGFGGVNFGINLPRIELPSFEYGGIVPGPIGQPVPVIAHGGEKFLGANGGGAPVININVSGSVITERELGEFVRRYLYGNQNQNYSLGFK